MYHLLRFFHVRPANQPTITDVALCHKKFGCPCCKYFIKSGLYFWGHGLQYLAFFNFNFNPRDRVPNTTYWAKYSTGAPGSVHRHSGFTWKKICERHKQKAILWRSRNIESSSNVYSSSGNNNTGHKSKIPLTTKFGALYRAQRIPFTPPLLNSNYIFITPFLILLWHAEAENSTAEILNVKPLAKGKCCSAISPLLKVMLSLYTPCRQTEGVEL